MTEAERELVEAIMDPNPKRGDTRVSEARNKVARERLGKEIPGWEKEAKSAYMFYRRAACCWWKWEARLEQGSVYSRYSNTALVEGWSKEFDDE